jgi:hypothetical protein
MKDVTDATIGIYAALKPYRKILGDQTWVLVLAHLKKIEQAIKKVDKREKE